MTGIRALALSSVAGLGVLIIGCSRQTPEVSEAISTESPVTPVVVVEEVAELPEIPQDHQTVLDALAQRRMINFKDLTPDEGLAQLSITLGLEIRIDPKLRMQMHPDRKLKLRVDAMVSHQTGIHVILREVGVYNAGMRFEDGAVVLVPVDDVLSALRTIDLRGRSDLTLAKREQLMRQVVGSIHPESWSESGTWIRKGESVFEIDVYQTPEVHQEVSQILQGRFVHAVSFDEDIMALQQLPLQPLQGTLTSTDVPFGNTRPAKGSKAEEIWQPKDVNVIVERLRKRFPFESMTKRLGYEDGPREVTVPRLSEAAEKRLSDKDAQFAAFDQTGFAWSGMRTKSLKMLHESEVAEFVGRPGAGLSRMPVPGPSYLPRMNPQELPLADADMIRFDTDVAVELPATRKEAAPKRISLPSVATMERVHFTGEASFVSPQGLGYVRDKDHVAGFTPHGMEIVQRVSSYLRQPWYIKQEEMWAIHRFELVSLLKHKEARVYSSRNMPRMEDLVNTKTRALDEFERSALKKLHDGEDVVISASLNRIHMLGSLRASNQCRQCHNVKRGALLGAFSYELLRDPQIDPQEFQPEQQQLTSVN